MSMQQIILSGIGGQGVLFVTRLLAETALELQHPVLISETHGMAQRGGNVISHLKIGAGFTSPLIRPGRADVFLGFHPDAMQVHGFYLKPGGRAFCNASPSDSPFSIDATSAALAMGSPVSANLILVGAAAASGILFCRATDLEKTLRRLGGQKTEINLLAFRRGIELFQGAGP
ncbi:MAG: indolepyruvate oxidoreductase [Deltaproteobacteria bacterium]|nr:indolepyruvate oxidoreductase [Deltaproteobacteria bacterium]